MVLRVCQLQVNNIRENNRTCAAKNETHSQYQIAAALYLSLSSEVQKSHA